MPRMPRKPRPGKPATAKPAAKARPKAVKSAADTDDNSGSAILGGIEVAELRRLIRLVQRTGIGELEVSAGGRAVRISARLKRMFGATQVHFAFQLSSRVKMTPSQIQCSGTVLVCA